MTELGVPIGLETVHRFFPRHAISVEQAGHAIEQDRPDVLRLRWFDGQLDLDPERLLFLDETWTATNTTRSDGRCRRGGRLHMGFPHNHRKITTLDLCSIEPARLLAHGRYQQRSLYVVQPTLVAIALIGAHSLAKDVLFLFRWTLY